LSTPRRRSPVHLGDRAAGDQRRFLIFEITCDAGSVVVGRRTVHANAALVAGTGTEVEEVIGGDSARSTRAS
jgi:hypothetical protein